MKRIQFAILIATLLLCPQAIAETPQAAYGVTIVGTAGGTAGLRGTNLSTHPYVLLGGYFAAADNGGGYFAMGPSGCTDNGGTILKDSAGDCFYRTDARAAIPVQWFGAKCDAVTTVYGGTISSGSTTFTSSGVTFQTSDVGKTIELLAATGNPFRTTITAVNGPNSVTLNHAAYNFYPDPRGRRAQVSFPSC